MAEQSNFWDEIKRRVDLVEYLSSHAGADFVSDGPGRVAACCPFHAEDTPSFKVTDARSGEPWKVWRCYGACSEGGTIIDAVMRREGFSEAIEAADFLNELYELGFERDHKRYEAFKKTVAQAEASIERAQEEMRSESKAATQAREYLRRRGLSDETIDHFQLAVDTHDARSGRLAIPIYDRANHAISVSHRALFDSYPCATCNEPVTAKTVAKRMFLDRKAREKGTERVDWEACPHCGAGKTEARISWLVQQYPKYKNQEGHDKSRVLYNQPSARKAIREPETIGYFIMEGYGDVWACHQGGQLACSSYNGATISDWQAGEAAKLCLAQHPPKPIVLVPDFDATGMSSVRTNMDVIRHANPQVEIQIISSLAFEELHPKDLGELLQKKGAEAVAKVLAERRISAEEWLIRDTLDATIAKTGRPAHSKSRQMELVAEILGGVRHRISLDHIVPLLSERWGVVENQARSFLNSSIGGQAALPAQHLMKTIVQAHEEAQAYLREAFVIPHGFEEIDRCLPGGGARTKQLAMFLGKSGTGKASSVDSLVLTPSGWRRMGDLEPGDQVIDPETGHATTILSVHPQGERDLYRVHFSDGSSCECDLEHLWKVKDSNGKWQVRTLAEIRDSVDLSRTAHMIPVTAPVHFAQAAEPLPIDPYLLGALLGDGSMSQRDVRITAADPEIVGRVRELLPTGMTMRPLHKPIDWILNKPADQRTNPLIGALRSLGLMGKTAPSKFVPKQYLLANPDARLELLRGLLDTDGSVTEVSRPKVSASVNVEFCTASEQLADDVLFLVRSLGGVGRISRSSSAYTVAGERKVCRDRFRVRISMPPGVQPFWLARKADRYCRSMAPSRRMTKIEFSRRGEAQCIALDSSSHLYITDDFIVTHNTMMTTQLLANMARSGIRSIFFSLEQPAGQLYLRMACQTLEVSMDTAIELIKAGDERLSEVDRLFENLVIVDNVPEDATQMVDMTPSRIMKIIQEINLTRFSEPAQVVAIDHLGIVKVPEDAPRSVQSDDLQAAGYIMQELFAVTKITDVYMMVLQQLPKEVKAGVSFSMDAGRGGSKQTDYCDFIFQIWRPEQSAELEDEERMALSGQYKLQLGKNRHGASVTANLYFDKATLRILPALNIMPPSTGEGLADVASGPAVTIGAGPAADDGMGDWEAVESAAGAESPDGPGQPGAPAVTPAIAPVDEGAAITADEADEQASAPAAPPVLVSDGDPNVPLDAMTLLELLGSPVSADGDGDLAPDYFDS